MKNTACESKRIVVRKADSLADYERTCFVIKALGIGKHPHFTTVVHAEPARIGTRLVGTDGKRIHVALIRGKIPRGNYIPKQGAGEIALEKCNEEIRYPAWKNVVPENAEFKCEIDLAGTNKGKFLSGAEKLSVANSILAKKTGRMVNYKFLSDLPEKIWNLYADSPNTKPIMLKDLAAEDLQFAVFAPLAA